MGGSALGSPSAGLESSARHAQVDGAPSPLGASGAAPWWWAGTVAVSGPRAGPDPLCDDQHPTNDVDLTGDVRQEVADAKILS